MQCTARCSRACGSAEIRCLYTIYIIGINKASGKFWLKNKNKDKLQGVLLVCVSSANTGTKIIEVTFPRSHTLHGEERYIAFQWRATFAVLQPNYFPNIPFTSSSKSELIGWVLLKISYSLSAFSLACSAEIHPLSEAGCP